MARDGSKRGKRSSSGINSDQQFLVSMPSKAKVFKWITSTHSGWAVVTGCQTCASPIGSLIQRPTSWLELERKSLNVTGGGKMFHVKKHKGLFKKSKKKRSKRRKR